MALFPQDRKNAATFALRDKARIHLEQVLKKKPNDQVKVLVIGEGLGMARVQSINFDLELEFLEPYSIASPLDLALPLPRPQTGKKILHLAGAYGLQTVHFFRPRQRNSDYTTSPVYQSDLNEFLIEGMAQSGQSRLPKVIFSDIYVSEIDTVSYLNKVVFHPAESSFRTFCLELGDQQSTQSTLFVLGPESGLFEEEILQFKEKGFQVCALSNRILRTEFALAQALYEWESARN